MATEEHKKGRKFLGMSKMAYAKHAGVSPTTVYYWIRSGKIPLLADGSVDLEMADASRARFGTGGKRGPKVKSESALALLRQVDAAQSVLPGQVEMSTGVESSARHLPVDTDGNVINFEYQRARVEFFKAEQSRLKFEAESGSLVQRGTVEGTIFVATRMTRNALMAIPSRIAGELAAASTEREAFDILHDELYQCLDTLEDTLGEYGASGPTTEPLAGD